MNREKRRTPSRKTARALGEIRRMKAHGAALALPNCPVTRKSSYASPAVAGSAIAKINANSDRDVRPQRAYQCEHCDNWHLTSKDYREYTVR